MSDTKRPVGRPRIYTDELAYTICERIALGESLKAICSCDDMPSQSTVFAWLKEIREFSELYAQARELQAHCIIDEILEIADNVTADNAEIQKAKLRIDTRKWLASKLNKTAYGDKSEIAIKHQQKALDEMTDEELQQKLDEIGVKL